MQQDANSKNLLHFLSPVYMKHVFCFHLLLLIFVALSFISFYDILIMYMTLSVV
jgi:hypothetical protein